MKKSLVTLLLLAVIGGSGYAYFKYKDNGPKFTVTTAQISRGDIVDTVGATGTLQAVTTVQVGTQVSGTIQNLYADYNSLVKKGQVLARLDPSLFATQIDQAKANLIRAQADLERLKVALDDANQKLTRARELSNRKLIPQTDLDTAEVNARSAEAQIRSQEAQITQAQASLSQNDVNLQHTVIEAPIDGLVISRSVDVGQTVAASMQAPTLFVLAADLTKMQVVANLDESDVGRIRPNQTVSFRVDAYPNETFIGKVSQVRLEPKVNQNVVTYATVIDVPNNDLKLKPGMTANVNVEIAKSSNVLRIPNSALRFRPTNEMYAAIGQTPPEPPQRGDGGTRRGGPPSTAGGATAPAPAAQPAPAGASTAAPAGAASGRSDASSHKDHADAQTIAPGGGGEGSAPQMANGRGGSGSGGNSGSTGGGRGGSRGGSDSERMNSRTQNMTPEERDQMLQRMRARGADSGSGSSGTAPRGGRGAAPASASADQPMARPAGATTIDALFGALPRVETAGRAWLYVDKQLKQVRLRLGITDGQNTELIEGDLEQGTQVVTNIVTTTESTRPAATAFPFGQPGRGGPGGFGGGGFGGPGGGGNRGGGGGGGGRGR